MDHNHSHAVHVGRILEVRKTGSTLFTVPTSHYVMIVSAVAIGTNHKHSVEFVIKHLPPAIRRQIHRRHLPRIDVAYGHNNLLYANEYPYTTSIT